MTSDHTGIAGLIRRNRIFILFICIIFVLLIFNIGDKKSFFNPDEHFYFKSCQSISSFKDCYGPEYFGENRFQKPPLFYILVRLSFGVFGVNWFSARIISVFSGLMLLTVVYMFGILLFGREKALFAAASFGTSILFFRFSRIVLPEMIFIFFVIFSLYSAYLAFEHGKRFYMFSFICMGLACLIKGPIGFFLPGMVIYVHTLIYNDKIKDHNIPWIKGLLIIFIAMLLWLGPSIIFYGKTFIEHIISAEIIERLHPEMDNVTLGNMFFVGVKQIFLYIPIIFIESLPWSVILPVFIIMGRDTADRQILNEKRGFLMIWVLSGYILYTFLQSKRNHYMLTIQPAVLMFAVSFIDVSRGKMRSLAKKTVIIVLILYGLMVTVIWPMIFTDGVDILSMKMREQLDKIDAPVYVSWSLDQQEVELYLNRRTYMVLDGEFTQGFPVQYKMDPILERKNGYKNIFYLMMGEKEALEYYDWFIKWVGNILVNKPLKYEKLMEDMKWRKKIDIAGFLRDFINDPAGIRRYFNEYFKEKVVVYLIKTQDVEQ